MNLIPRDLFNNLLDDFFNVPASKNNIMKVDIFEKDNLYNMEIEIPGFNKENIMVDYKDGYLTISAKKDEVKEDKEYIRKERFYGEYQRSFYVGDIDDTQINAQFNDGLLTITFPKQDDNNSRNKRIEIQ
ncbi:MAG TPA: Hsp20/alpha crystallin family protein [Mollicutes bacterium]|nr:Hsp20/alpha crystallin family protein [Mollicutes bacterium]